MTDSHLHDWAFAAGLLEAMEKEALLRAAVVRLVDAARLWRSELPAIVTPESCRTEGSSRMLHALRDIDGLLTVRKP